MTPGASTVRPHDVVQLVLEHKWAGCFAIVSEVRPWGVVAYIPIPLTEGTGNAPVRLAWSDFEPLGVRAPFSDKTMMEDL